MYIVFQKNQETRGYFSHLKHIHSTQNKEPDSQNFQKSQWRATAVPFSFIPWIPSVKLFKASQSSHIISVGPVLDVDDIVHISKL